MPPDDADVQIFDGLKLGEADWGSRSLRRRLLANDRRRHQQQDRCDHQNGRDRDAD